MIPELNSPLKINDDPEKIKETGNRVKKAIEVLEFMKQTLETGRMTQRDADTHVSLLLAEIEDMKDSLELDEIQEKILRWENKSMANMATETRLLQQEIGKRINAAQLSAALKTARDRFENWYEWAGFHYAAIEYSQYGILARLTQDVYEYDEDDDPPAETKFGPNSEYKFELIKQPYHSQLKDCDQNRAELRRMLTRYFPNIQFRKFESRRSEDPNEFALETTVFVQYTDIEDIKYD